MVCNARFVGKMRRIFRPVGDLVDILKRVENNMPDAGLNGGVIRNAPSAPLKAVTRSF